jgi:hypothetical protein
VAADFQRDRQPILLIPLDHLLRDLPQGNQLAPGEQPFGSGAGREDRGQSAAYGICIRVFLEQPLECLDDHPEAFKLPLLAHGSSDGCDNS